MELHRALVEIEAEEHKRKNMIREITPWVAVLGEDCGLRDLIKIKETVTETGNLAGLDIPIFTEVLFEPIPYDLFEKPLWVDAAVETIKKLLETAKKLKILKGQAELISEELRVTTQRVNLFEKVKIPETEEHIRVIRIYLGDEQTASVVRGKIAKNKLVEK